MKHRRPLMPTVVPWRLPGPTGANFSYGAVARRPHRAWIYCGHCVPPWEIAAINFNQLPWLRFHNYPIEAGFRCPVCRRLTTMHVMYYDIPNTGGDKPMYDD